MVVPDKNTKIHITFTLACKALIKRNMCVFESRVGEWKVSVLFAACRDGDPWVDG